jgi:hypothetical protein
VRARLVVAAIVLALLAGLWWIARAPSPPDYEARSTAEVALLRAPAVPLDAPRPDSEAASSAGAVSSSSGTPAPEAAAVSPTEDSLGLVLHGRVRDPDGTPMNSKSSWISFTDESGSRLMTRPQEDATYSISGLHPGRWTASVWAQQYRPTQSWIELAGEPRSQERDFVLHPAIVLQIKLSTPSGAPLYNALHEGPGSRTKPAAWRPYHTTVLPVATAQAPGEWLADLQDKNPFGVGSWLWGELPPGCSAALVLSCDLPVHVSAVFHHLVLLTKQVEPGTSEVEFVVDPEALLRQLGGVRVTVAEASGGAPPQDVSVELADERFGLPETGPLSIDNIAPGDSMLHVSAPAHERISRKVRIEPGRITDLGTILLGPEVILRGRVVDPAGQPVSTAISSGRFDPATDSVLWDREACWRTRADGTFEFRGLGRGRFALRTVGADEIQVPGQENVTNFASGIREVDATVGSVDGIVIACDPVARVLFDLEGFDPDGWRIRVLDEHGLELRSRTLQAMFPLVLALPRGRCRVLLFDPGGAQRADVPFTSGPAASPVRVRPE